MLHNLEMTKEIRKKERKYNFRADRPNSIATA